MRFFIFSFFLICWRHGVHGPKQVKVNQGASLLAALLKANECARPTRFFLFQFWRFVFVQQVMAKELQTFLDYPPMQKSASFNLDAVKAEMTKRMAQAEAASKGTGQ
jgi:hypothetical protein